MPSFVPVIVGPLVFDRTVIGSDMVGVLRLHQVLGGDESGDEQRNQTCHHCLLGYHGYYHVGDGGEGGQLQFDADQQGDQDAELFFGFASA